MKPDSQPPLVMGGKMTEVASWLVVCGAAALAMATAWCHYIQP